MRRTSISLPTPLADQLRQQATVWRVTYQELLRCCYLCAAAEPPTRRNGTRRARFRGRREVFPVLLDQTALSAERMLVPKFFAKRSSALSWAIANHVHTASAVLQDPTLLQELEEYVTAHAPDLVT